MNYRHGFHAGNFADLAKHAALLAFLRLLRNEGKPVRVVDTHAGAGYYDLSNPDFARSKEAEAGIKYLLGSTVPDSLRPLGEYVRAKNAKAGFRAKDNQPIGIYPGSPTLVLDHRTPKDSYIGCELRSDDFMLLADRIEPLGQAFQQDGYRIAVQVADDSVENAEEGEERSDLVYLIDPPFELPSDYSAIVDTLKAVLAVRADARALVWLPLKDLETFDAFLRHLERDVVDGDLPQIPAVVVSELRLRSLWNPMKMNGCALLAVNAPAELEDTLRSIAKDVVAVFGEDGGEARTWKL